MESTSSRQLTQCTFWSICHRTRWAIYRTGMDTKKDNDMIEHNKDQTEKQKARRNHLGNTGQIIEAIMVQNDLSLSYTKILKPISWQQGVIHFQHSQEFAHQGNIVLWTWRRSWEIQWTPKQIKKWQYFSISMVWMIWGDQTDWFSNDFHLEELPWRDSWLRMKTIEPKCLLHKIPSSTGGARGSGNRPGDRPRTEEPETEKSSHQDEYHIHLQMTSPWPKPPRMNQLHLVVLWEQVLKAHAAKVRPASPAPKAMPDQTSTSRRPPDLPETPRKSTEKGKYNRSFDQIAPWFDTLITSLLEKTHNPK